MDEINEYLTAVRADTLARNDKAGKPLPNGINKAIRLMRDKTEGNGMAVRIFASNLYKQATMEGLDDELKAAGLVPAGCGKPVLNEDGSLKAVAITYKPKVEAEGVGDYVAWFTARMAAARAKAGKAVKVVKVKKPKKGSATPAVVIPEVAGHVPVLDDDGNLVRYQKVA